MICLNSNAKRRAVLALGGGGARGLAHLGAIQAVEEAGIEIERIVGVSIGSLAGALAAARSEVGEVAEAVLAFVHSPEFGRKQEALFGANPSPEGRVSTGLLAWYDRLRSYLWAQQLVHRVFRRRSILPGQVLDEVIASLVPDIDVSETKWPLSIVAVDLLSGYPVVIERGSLRKAIAASAAIPGIFPPVPWDGMLLCDLGVVHSLPSEVARSYASDLVIGVDVGPRQEPIERCDSALHVLFRMDEIAERLVRRRSRELVDVLIRPQVGQCQWFDFSKSAEMIDEGLRAGRVAMRHVKNFDERCQAILTAPYLTPPLDAATRNARVGE